MMRKISLLIGLLLVGLTMPAFAQAPDISGVWKGALEIPGTRLEMEVEFKKDGAKWTGEMDIPLQKAKDLPITEIVLDGHDLSFKLPDVPSNASFKGKVEANDEKISGDFNQMGQNFPLKLMRQSAADKAAAEARIAQAVKDFTLLADSLRKMQHVVGMSIAIVKDDKVLLSKGFGEKEFGKGNAVDDQTLFAIGSSTKAFTAASLAILADEGKLDWEKPIRHYLPDFKMYDDFATQEMTAIDLLCHRSGLPRHEMMWYGSRATREEIYHRLQYLQPNKSFRSTWQYQNLMVMTAGYLAGKLNGTSWEALVKERIFKPLGMNVSNFSVAELEKSPNAAKGYRWNEEKKQSTLAPYRMIDEIGPAGSINSNAQEMTAWLRMQLGNGKLGDKTIITPTQMKRMHTPQMTLGKPAKSKEISAPSYGLGWFLYNYKGHRVVEHGGNIDGFSAEVFLMPDDAFGMVVLTNLDGSDFRNVLCNDAADMFLGLPPTDWYSRFYGADKENDGQEEKPAKPASVKGTKPSHELADYVGDYQHPGYGKISITLQGKELHAKLNDLAFEMSHFHYDAFSGHLAELEQDILFAFHTGKEGDVNQVDLALEAAVDDIEFKKLPPASLSDPAVVKQFVGKYEFAKGQLVIDIVLVGDHLLQADVAGQAPALLEPWRNTQFKLHELNGYSLEFVASKSGAYETMILRQPGLELEGKRK